MINHRKRTSLRRLKRQFMIGRRISQEDLANQPRLEKFVRSHQFERLHYSAHVRRVFTIKLTLDEFSARNIAAVMGITEQ